MHEVKITSRSNNKRYKHKTWSEDSSLLNKCSLYTNNAARSDSQVCSCNKIHYLLLVISYPIFASISKVLKQNILVTIVQVQNNYYNDGKKINYEISPCLFDNEYS